MYSYQIKDMIQALIRDGIINKNKEETAIASLSKYWSDTIALTWNIDDIMGLAKDNKIRLSKKKARIILQEIFTHHDCSVGVSWNLILYYLHQHYIKGGSMSIKSFIEIAKGTLNAYTAEGAKAKASFHRQGKQVLKAIADELDLAPGTYDIRSNLGGMAVSGEVILHGERLYIQFHSYDGMFMYRSCKGRKDYCGGTNNWMDYDDLNNIPEACKKLKRTILS